MIREINMNGRTQKTKGNHKTTKTERNIVKKRENQREQKKET